MGDLHIPFAEQKRYAASPHGSKKQLESRKRRSENEWSQKDGKTYGVGIPGLERHVHQLWPPCRPIDQCDHGTSNALERAIPWRLADRQGFQSVGGCTRSRAIEKEMTIMMTGSQTFVLILLLGGAISFAIFMVGLGVYYWGRSKYESSKREGAEQSRSRKRA